MQYTQKKKSISGINTLCFNRHEDGTVRFWDASGVALTPIYKLSTANVFHTDCDPCDDPQDPSNDPDIQQEEEWPPFRKVRAEGMCVQGGLGCSYASRHNGVC